MTHSDHSTEHAAYCWGITSPAWRASMTATACPYCKAWDAGYRAGYLNGSGEDNDVIVNTYITVQGGTA